ncbi:MAG: TolC family protein [Gemmatimonadota bacterium]
MVRANRPLRFALVAALLALPGMAQAQGNQPSQALQSLPPMAPAPQSVTLAQALQRSEQVSPTVVQSANSIRSAELQVRTAKWRFVPQLSFTPQASLLMSSGDSRLDPVTGEVISGNSSNPNYGFNVTATLPIFDGFIRNYDLKAARAREDAATSTLVSTKFTNTLNVTNTFLTVLADKRLLAVDSTAVLSAEQQYNVAVAKLRAGSGSISDSLSALVSLNNAKFTMLGHQNTLATDEAQLGRAIGADGRVGAVDDPAYYQLPAAIDTLSLRRDARASSPQLRAAQATLEALRQATKSNKAQYFPNLSISVGDNFTANKQSDYSLKGRKSLNLGLTITPWTNFARETQIENAQIQVENQQASLLDQQHQIDANLTAQFAAISNAQAQIQLSETSATAAETNLRVVTARYGQGVATITELLQAQTNLTQAQVNAVQARYAYLRAKVQIESILGRSLP